MICPTCATFQFVELSSGEKRSHHHRHPASKPKRLNARHVTRRLSLVFCRSLAETSWLRTTDRVPQYQYQVKQYAAVRNSITQSVVHLAAWLALWLGEENTWRRGNVNVADSCKVKMYATNELQAVMITHERSYTWYRLKGREKGQKKDRSLVLCVYAVPHRKGCTNSSVYQVQTYFIVLYQVPLGEKMPSTRLSEVHSQALPT